MIYFAQQDGDTSRVKIGVTGDLAARLLQLSRAADGEISIITSCDGDYQLETKVQNRFAYLHLGYEWFHVDDSLRDFIERVAYGIHPAAAVDDLDAPTGSIRGQYGMSRAIYAVAIRKSDRGTGAAA